MVLMPPANIVRAGRPPDDMTVVVRGGERSLDDLLLDRAVSDCWAAHGFFGLSVFADPEGFDLDNLARSTPLIRRRVVRVAVVARLRESGFEVIATFTNRYHFSIVLPDVSSATCSKLRDCFGLSLANPAYETG